MQLDNRELYKNHDDDFVDDDPRTGSELQCTAQAQPVKTK